MAFRDLRYCGNDLRSRSCLRIAIKDVKNQKAHIVSCHKFAEVQWVPTKSENTRLSSMYGMWEKVRAWLTLQTTWITKRATAVSELGTSWMNSKITAAGSGKSPECLDVALWALSKRTTQVIREPPEPRACISLLCSWRCPRSTVAGDH